MATAVAMAEPTNPNPCIHTLSIDKFREPCLLFVLINIIKTQDVWAHPQDVAKTIVENIIPNYGKEFRYIIGTDAKNLINAICNNKDDVVGMDKKITDIMSRYFT